MPPNRAHLTTIAIAGLTSGIGAASVNIAARFTSDPGDVLGFFGGALGAGLAILGALWLESNKNEKILLSKREYLAKAIHGLIVRAETIPKCDPSTLYANIKTLTQTVGTFKVLLDRNTPDEPEISAVLDTLYITVKNLSDRLDSYADENSIDTSDLGLQKIKICSDAVAKICRTALRHEHYWPPSYRLQNEQV